MKVRIKFQKYGSMKFVGHLDVMRYLQKANRRANIDNEYTKGFSPHQIMSFAAPLGVGLTSDSEYVDLQLLSNTSAREMIDQMNSAYTEGFRVIGFHPLLEQIEHQKTVTAMSLVDSADYLVSLKDGYSITEAISSQEEFKKAFQLFINQQEIIIDKKTKTSEKSVNIKSMISFTAFDPNEYEEKIQVTLGDKDYEITQNSLFINLESVDGITPSSLLKSSESVGEITPNSLLISSESVDEITPNSLLISSESVDEITPNSLLISSERVNETSSNSLSIKTESVADVYKNGVKVYMQIDTGSSSNLKPELVIEAFYDSLGIPFEKLAWQVHRLNLYTRDVESGKLFALDQVER